MAYFVDTRLELTAAIVAWLVKTLRGGGEEGNGSGSGGLQLTYVDIG